jgi:hypothetical protein
MTKSKRAHQTHGSAASNSASNSIGADLIWGAAAIGAEIGVGERKAFYMLERHLIPRRKIGGLWVASRRELRTALCGAATETSDAA